MFRESTQTRRRALSFVNGDSAWQRGGDAHVLFKHLLGLLRLADLKDETFVGELHALLGQRFFEIVNLHHAEMIGLHGSLEGRRDRAHGSVGRQFEQYSYPLIYNILQLGRGERMDCLPLGRASQKDKAPGQHDDVNQNKQSFRSASAFRGGSGPEVRKANRQQLGCGSSAIRRTPRTGRTEPRREERLQFAVREVASDAKFMLAVIVLIVQLSVCAAAIVIIDAPTNKTDDAELVRRAKAGDLAAFEALVTSHERRVYTIARRISGNDQDAEDVTQQTLLSVVENLNGFREESSFSTWIQRIATYAALKVLRKRNGLPTVSLEEQTEPREGYDTVAHPEYIADWRESPEQLVGRNETSRLIDEALNELDDKHRVIFLLRDVQGLSVKETAEALGLSEANVKVRLLRARLQLRERLTLAFGDPARRFEPHRHEEP